MKKVYICVKCWWQRQGAEWFVWTQDTIPVNLAALQDLCTALTSATLEDGEESLSVAEFLKVSPFLCLPSSATIPPVLESIPRYACCLLCLLKEAPAGGGQYKY